MRTLLVGDEPRDIVFAGPAPDARVHHHRPPRPEHAASIRSSPRPASAAPTSGCSTPTTSARRSAATPLTIAHAVRRHAARAGRHARRQHGLRGGLPLRATGPPSIHERRRDAERLPPPADERPGRADGRRPRWIVRSTGPIVQSTGSHWLDETGRRWDDRVRFSPARQGRVRDRRRRESAGGRSPRGVFTGVGTMLFNMVVNPVSGKVYVANTEARNDVRFEGPASSADAGAPAGRAATSPRAASPCSIRRRRRDAAPPEQAHRLRAC